MTGLHNLWLEWYSQLVIPALKADPTQEHQVTQFCMSEEVELNICKN
jgi:hypothetical protein